MTTLDEIARDKWDRPMVVPPNGTKPIAYTRCTTYVGCLEDMYNVQQWEKRHVAKGLAMRPDLLLAVAATDLDDKDKLNGLVDKAKEAAATNAKATIGTAIHKLTERIDRGEPLGVIPDTYRADLAAYEKATANLTALMVEQFCVNDDLKIGGTPDRVVELDGTTYIADVKTGDITWGAAKIAMQLAVYAHCVAYDHLTHTRTPLPNVDLQRAIIIHLPAGTGTCQLLWVDIETGWEQGVPLAGKVRQWRNVKHLTEPLVATPRRATPASPAAAKLAAPPAATPPVPVAGIDQRIATAKTVEQLVQLYWDHQDTWNDVLTELAAARKALLQAGVA